MNAPHTTAGEDFARAIADLREGARALCAADRADEAREALRAALVIDPTHPGLRADLAALEAPAPPSPASRPARTTVPAVDGAALNLYAINLEHRTDRWQTLRASSQAMGLAPDSIRRWPAVADRRFGALGCAKSHLGVLADFLTRGSAPYCLVMEDDFELLRPWSDLAQVLGALDERGTDWDALLLTGTKVVAHAPQPTGVARLFESQSGAAYLVARRYVPQLMACFAESVVQMEALQGRMPHDAIAARFAIDQAWKPLQRRDRWYIASPAFGRQRPSFSDIEGREVNYDAMTYGLAKA